MTAYNGPAPDFSLQGEAAQQEFAKFELHESIWTAKPGYFTLGPEEKWVTGDSLKPIMSNVSAESVKYEKRAKPWHWTAQGLVLAAVVYYFADLEDWKNRLPVLLGTGVISTGFNLRATYLHNRAIETYNRDMKGKFTPALTYNLEF